MARPRWNAWLCSIICTLLLWTMATRAARAAPLYSVFGFDPFVVTPPNDKGQVASMYAHQYPALFDGFGPNAGNSGVEIAQQTPSLGTVVNGGYGALGGLRAVNNSGQATGIISGLNQALLVSDGVAKAIGTLDASAGDSDQQPGTGYRLVRTPRRFRPRLPLHFGKMQDLGTLPGGRNSLGFAINDSGQVAGFSETTSTTHWWQGFMYPNLYGGQIFPSPMTAHAVIFAHGNLQDLATLGGTNSVALGINGSGVAVGASELSNGAVHAFIYQGGHLVDLGTLGSRGIPDHRRSDVERGECHQQRWSDCRRSNGHAFLYDQGKMYDLNNILPIPHVTLENAISINNLGQIMV